MFIRFISTSDGTHGNHNIADVDAISIQIDGRYKVYSAIPGPTTSAGGSVLGNVYVTNFKLTIIILNEDKQM